ncbi:response regulator [Psychroflexus sp. ALD_RP9]|uniref:hybrid sensor histidine kinase/response regulator transcription factor n=1 Tax=Psychroflexus sp. ALD_RP9 TaxID=2777186 RepID=UPI001A8C9D5A|nr:response regulator [Psychroflexus sp. ALD_RP9]QSS97590.1 response regulator [Psychroflexus sp. ALD_RP9]
MNFWKKALNVGVSSDNKSKEKKRIRLLNLVAYISIAHALFFLVFDALTDIFDLQKALTLGTQLLLFFTIIYIQYKQRFLLARALFFLLVFVILFYHCNYAFKGFYGEYQYIVLPLISLFFFDNKYLHYFLLCIAIAAFYLPNLYFNNYPEAYFGYFNVSLLFGGLFLLVSFFKNENDKNELLLKKEKDIVVKDKKLLEKQQNELKELNRFKSNFFTNISHEIRTPITLVKGYAERLSLTENNKENSEYLDIIQMQANKIEGIVNDLLNLSKLDANQLLLRKSAIEITNFINKLYNRYKKLFSDKGIQLSLDINISPVTIEMDKDYFEKSLENILENALKFTPKNGEVIIAIHHEEALKISILDNGVGIPQKDLPKVFKRFYQADNDITRSVGTGIGLSFAKSIIEKHGFSVDVESIPDIETKFTIKVPAQFIIEVSKINNHYLENTLQSKIKSLKDETILIVEDNIDMQNYLKLVLKDFKVVLASNGLEGIKLVEKHKPKAIITDYMMPVMNGLELVKELKSQSLKTPVIVLTASNSETDKLNMLRVGIDAYLTKPFNEEELLLGLTKAIKYYKQIQQFEQKIPNSEKLKLSNQHHDYYQEILAIIEKNYSSKNFGVEQLAEMMNLSRSSLFRKTKYFLGQTPNELIKEVRYQKARLLLIEKPKISKTELAEAVGLYNATYFYNNLQNRFNNESSK